MAKKLYIFTCEKSNQRFEEYLTDTQAGQVLGLLNYVTDDAWKKTDGIEQMLRYNTIIQSLDYKEEIEKFKKVYAGTNLIFRVNRYHKNLGVRPLEGREIFEQFKL